VSMSKLSKKRAASARRAENKYDLALTAWVLTHGTDIRLFHMTELPCAMLDLLYAREYVDRIAAWRGISNGSEYRLTLPGLLRWEAICKKKRGDK